MNPRVSRSSALASKATGFPIAKIAAKLALGYHLDEIPNDITRVTPASFEPSIDYVVVKMPRWNFEKFPEADRTLTTQMKSVGEAMAIGAHVQGGVPQGAAVARAGPAPRGSGRPGRTRTRARRRWRAAWRWPTSGGSGACSGRSSAGWSVERIHEITPDRPAGSSSQFEELTAMALRLKAQRAGRAGAAAPLHALKHAGFSNEEIARLSGRDEAAVGGGRRGRPASRAPTSGSTRARPSSSRSRRTSTAPSPTSARRRRRRARRSSSSGRARTGSARGSSSTTAAATPRSRCARRASRR